MTNNGRQITVAEMAPHIHSFLPNENKVNKIANWLSDWITVALQSGRIKPLDFLPQKGDLAFHIGVSLGTMQNAYRLVEDLGLIKSKQKIGTYIADSNIEQTQKLVSKRDVVCSLIKEHIIDFGYKTGDKLLSIRKLSNIIKCPPATIRIALNVLIKENIIRKDKNAFVVTCCNFNKIHKEQRNLVDDIAEKINIYINKNLSKGDKIPSNNTFADMYGVSLKTVYDAIKILSVAGIVTPRRGYYGTVVSSEQDNKMFYFYEQVKINLKKYISENCKTGDKLPTIKEFAEVFNVSTKTIKNALDSLSDDGVIRFVRGRFGGTYVENLPVITEQGYTWLALSPEFFIR